MTSSISLQVLLFVLDVFGDENATSPAVALKELMREIELYDDSLLDRPKVVFLNKYDVAADSDDAKKRLKKNEQQVRRIAEALTLPVLCGRYDIIVIIVVIESL